MGPNALWLTEWLCESMVFTPGMRVLDMGCDRAMSPIFLAKEFGVQVWANDPWVSASDNWQRIREAGVDDELLCDEDRALNQSLRGVQPLRSVGRGR